MLMEHLSTECKDRLSVVQRLFGRPTCTCLPTHPLVFDCPIQDETPELDKKTRQLCKLAKARCDEGTHELGVLEVGNVVRF